MNYRIDAMIAGAEKAGTTSLGSYLAAHPRILTHLDPDSHASPIEFDVFVSGASEDPERFARAFELAFPRAPQMDEVVLGKSVSLLHEPEASRRLHAFNPECRLIVSLRNPVDRAYSSYWYQRFRGAESAESFEEALEEERRREAEGVWDPDRMYIAKGHYIEHLERLVGLFGRDRVFVILLDDLLRDPVVPLAAVCGFLGLEAAWPYATSTARRNAARRPRSQSFTRWLYREGLAKRVLRPLVPRRFRHVLLRWLRRAGSVRERAPAMDEDTRASLLAHYAPHMRRLASFLDRDLSIWDV